MRPKILYPLFAPLTSLKGVGPKNAILLEHLCGSSILSLLTHSPSNYIDRRNNPKIKDLKELKEDGLLDILYVSTDPFQDQVSSREVIYEFQKIS